MEAAMSTLSVEENGENFVQKEISQTISQESEKSGLCAICLEKIPLIETALVKGCEHSYCATCILRWASYNTKKPTCPQCKLPFEFLVVHRTLDGCVRDYMFEESVCLLLRAQWFVPLPVPAEGQLSTDEDLTHYQYDIDYEDDDDHYDEEDDEDYYVSSRASTLLIRNRRWGENGYIRGGRKQARPVCPPSITTVSAVPSSSAGCRGKATAIAVGSKMPTVAETTETAAEKVSEEVEGPDTGSSKGPAGRRARRTMRREAADKIAAAKHQQRLEKLGRIQANK